MAFQRLPVQNRLEKSMWFYSLFLKSCSVFVASFLVFVLLGRMLLSFFNATVYANVLQDHKKLINETCLQFFKKDRNVLFSPDK